ncbi:HTH-type transcriptional regulatory protein GabR [compost metagenome]
MERGYFAKHLRRMRLVYQRKHDLLLSAIQRTFGEKASVRGQGAGFHILLTLHSSGSARQLAEKAAAAGIRVTPMSYTWWSRPENDEPEFILGFSGIAEASIEEGVRLLAGVWDN